MPVMEHSVLVLLANGFEEVEATVPIDLLRRAGAKVTVASCSDNLLVEGRSKIILQADCLLSKIDDYLEFDLLILPGGPAVFDLRKRPEIINLIKSHAFSGKLIGAICAAPLLLLDAEILESDSDCTAHESTFKELTNLITDQAVVQNGKIITSRGAGTALEFALSLVENLFSYKKRSEIAESIHANI